MILAIGQRVEDHLVISVAILTLNRVVTPINSTYSFTVTVTATGLLRRAIELRGVKPIRAQ